MGHANVRLIKHEAVPRCGSFEVCFPDGRPSSYFYWDDLPSPRLRPHLVDGETALKQARASANGWPLRKVTRHWRRASLGRKCSEVIRHTCRVREADLRGRPCGRRCTGEPCPACNVRDPPELPDGFLIELDEKGWRQRAPAGTCGVARSRLRTPGNYPR